MVSALPSLKEGKTPVTSVSQVSRFSSTSLASISVVMALVLDAIMKSVLASTFWSLPSSRTPNPSANTTFPFSIRPMATPGTPVFFTAVSTNRLSSAIRASSSLCALFPANDSRVYPLGRSSSKIRMTWESRFSATADSMS